MYLNQGAKESTDDRRVRDVLDAASVERNSSCLPLPGLGPVQTHVSQVDCIILINNMLFKRKSSKSSEVISLSVLKTTSETSNSGAAKQNYCPVHSVFT